MTDSETNSPLNPSAELNIDPDALLRSLLRKEGTWVEWSQSCQQLQKSGYSPQKIFEATGFQPVHQNQIITAAQVYATLVAGNAPEAVLSHFQERGSDVLYELRILAQPERVSAATLAVEKGMDTDEAHQVAKAVKEFSRLSKPPEEFTKSAGDAVAYQCWNFARKQGDLQERSRLIARGLSYAQSPTARHQIEKLLTDFTVVKTEAAPRLPIYRLETDEDMPRVIPVVGRLPLTKADLQTVPLIEEVGPFRMVQHSDACAWVPLPGWQVVLSADDPVGMFTTPDRLPAELPGENQEVLLVVDRQEREWRLDSYFLVEDGEQLKLQWYASPPKMPLLGRLILVVRPKRVLDESVTLNPWLIDE